jgi:hypothetical protein
MVQEDYLQCCEDKDLRDVIGSNPRESGDNHAPEIESISLSIKGPSPGIFSIAD